MSWTAGLALALLFCTFLAPTLLADDGEPVYAGKGAAWWVEELRDQERAPAAYVAFKQIGESALPVLAAALDDEDGAFRERVLRTLHYTPGDKTLVLARIIEAVDDRSSGVAREALAILRELGPAAAPALPCLMDHLRVGTWANAYASMEVLAAMGEVAAPAEEVLLERLRDGRLVVRQGAVKTLGSVVPRSRKAVEALAAAFDSPETELRAGIAAGLVRFDPSIPGVFETLAAAAADPEAGVRLNAVASLLGMAGKDERVAGILVSALTDVDVKVVRVAVRGLCEVPARAAPAVPALQEILETEVEPESDGATQLLAAIAGCPETRDAVLPAIPALVKHLGTSWFAANALRSLLPESLPALLEALAQEDAQLRVKAFGIVERVPNETLAACATRVTGALRAFLYGELPERNVKTNALRLLARLAPDAPEATTLLLSLYDHPDAAVRHNLALLIAQVEPARAALLEMLGSASIDERDFAWKAMTLWRGPPDFPRTLVPLLRHPEADVRWRAADRLLGEVDVPRAGRCDLVQVMREWLASEGPEHRQSALYALARYHEAAVDAWDDVYALIGDANAQLALQAGFALSRIAPHLAESPVDRLTGELEGDDPQRASGAAFVLAELEAAPEVLLPPLRALLSSADPAVLLKALRAVRRMGPAARSLVPELIALVRRRPGAPTGEAALALGEIASDDPAALECLIDLLNDRMDAARMSAAQALGAFGEPALGALVAALDDRDPHFLGQVVGVLGLMRGKAAPARKRIEALRSHPEAEVRQSVGIALERIPRAP